MMRPVKVKYYLLVTANPLSESKAAISIFNMIGRLDIISEDITIFLPGFVPQGKSKTEEADTQEEIESKINSIKELNKEKFEDYHGKVPVFHTYLPSAGDIYFNDADFANFMLELQHRSTRFEYNGRTDLVVLPSSKGEIMYDQLVSFNLEPFKKLGSSELEEFFTRVFKLMRNDEDKNSLALIHKITKCYESYFKQETLFDTTDVTIRLDNVLLDFMKWKESDVIFFISYSSKDEEFAYKVKDRLVEAGIKVWMAPEGIPDGLDYARVIPAALRITSRCIVLLSRNSANSQWVRREIGRAISNNNKLNGILLDGFTAKDLNSYDHLSFFFDNIQLHYTINDILNNSDKFQMFLNMQ